MDAGAVKFCKEPLARHRVFAIFVTGLAIVVFTSEETPAPEVKRKNSILSSGTSGFGSNLKMELEHYLLIFK